MWLGTKSSMSRRPRWPAAARGAAPAPRRRPAPSMDRVAGDGEARIRRCPPRCRSGSVVSNSRAPLRGWTRETRRPAAPVCQTLSSQIQSKPGVGHRSSSRVRNVVERRGPAELPRQRRQPDARVDLVERRVARRWPCQRLLVRSRLRRRPADVDLGDRGRLAECQHLLRRCRREQVHEPGDDAGPAGLVAGAEPGAVVAVEVLVERARSRASAGPPGTCGCRRTPAGGRARRAGRCRRAGGRISSATW